MWLIIFVSKNVILSFLELFENEHVRIGQKGKLFKHFNWKIIALQCVGEISHKYTYIPSFLNLPPTAPSISPQ